MFSHFLVGSLTFVAVFGLSVHKNSYLRSCQGDDCHFEAAVRNRSEFADGRISCECCWQDCEHEKQHVQDLRLEQGEAIPITQDTIAGIDVWIIANAPELKSSLDWNRYTPILETVKVAVESEGSVAAIIGTSTPDLLAMIEGVKRAASQGRRPLVFSVAHEWWWDNLWFAIDKLKQAKDAGAYLVSYQAEPGYGEHGTMTQEIQAKALDIAEQMGADEIWDYTMANIKHYPKRTHMPIIRYVPPGYVQKMDVGVDVKSTLLNASKIGYMGNRHLKTMAGRYSGLLAGHINETNHVWSPDDLRAYLETYPVQLNQHRWQTCCPREKWEAEFQHFESFRMSSLLANKACVVSAPSAEEDMAIWKDVVTFVEVEDTLSTIEKLREHLPACRRNSYETYKREFDPRALLSKSGFFKVWQPPHGV